MFLENDKSSFEFENDERNMNGEVQLKGNIIPPYFVALEKLFNRHDAYIK